MQALYDTELDPDEFHIDGGTSQEELVAEFQDDARSVYEDKEEELGAELMREVERFLILQVVDLRWREHLDSMEYLRDGIHLRAMAQKDPLVEYRSEGHAMFEELGGDHPRRGRAPPLPRRGAAGGGPAARSRRPLRIQSGSRTSTRRSRAPTRLPQRAGTARGTAAARRSRPVRSARARRPSPPASARSPQSRRSAATTPAGADRGKKFKKCHGA